MSFASSHSIVFVTLVVSLLGLLVLYYRTQKHTYMLGQSFWLRVANHPPLSKQWQVRAVALGLAFLCMSFALLRPVWGEQIQTVTAEGTDVLFVLDVSKSMNALDMTVSGKTLDRLTAAKALIAHMVQENPQHRYGLVLFAGDSFVSAPLTSDTNAFISILNTADTRDIGAQGTDLVGALKMAMDRFAELSDDEQRAHSILLISDGGEEAPPELATVSEIAKQKAIRIFTLGIGGGEPVRIPDAVDAFGRMSYKTHNGQVVTTTLNEGPLQTIASRTDGAYVRLESGRDFQRVADTLNTFETSKITSGDQTLSVERYQIFLGLGVLFFVVSVFLERVLLLVLGGVAFVRRRQ